MQNISKLLLLSQLFGCSLFLGGFFARCGDGLREGNEGCDDGDRLDGNGCDHECQLEQSICGDGTLTPPEEECDDGNTTPGDGCDDACITELCADGIVNNNPDPNNPNEECDDGNNLEGDGCDADCLLEIPQNCGDGIVTAGEDCDLGPSNSQAPNAICRINCRIAGCGDGVIDDLSGETCDDGNNSNNDGCDSDCIPTIVLQVTAGSAHTCALFRSGGVRCWGEGDNGRLGYGNTNDIGDNELPRQAGDVNLGAPALQISAGGQHTCALLNNHKVLCWGANGLGQLGQNNTETIGDDEVPSSISTIDLVEDINQIAAGDDHTCARSVSGNVRCWGAGALGRLGYANQNNIGDNEPAASTVVDTVVTATQLGAGDQHTCALLSDQNLRCWGNNASGQLGRANTFNIGDDETPGSVSPINIDSGAIRIFGGNSFNCAIFDLGNVKCWGANGFGQLGQNNTSAFGNEGGETPFDLGSISFASNQRAFQGDAGAEHVCIVFETNVVRCWGRNNFGQLGLGNTTNLGDNELLGNTTVDVGSTVAAITAGGEHTCALLLTGKVRCWGNGANGRLGYGNIDIIGDNEPPSSAGDVPLF